MKLILSIILLFCINIIGFSQTSNEYWTSVSFENKLVKKTYSNVKLGYRVGDVFENNTKFLQVGVKRKLPYKLKLELGYRYANKENYKREFRYIHRPFVNLSKSFKLKKFKFTFRSKLQWEFKNQISRKKNDLQDFIWRNRLNIARKVFKRTYVFTASELYSFAAESVFDKYRFAGGVKWGMTKKIDFSLMTMYESEIYDTERSWVFGLSYAHKL